MGSWFSMATLDQKEQWRRQAEIEFYHKLPEMELSVNTDVWGLDGAITVGKMNEKIAKVEAELNKIKGDRIGLMNKIKPKISPLYGTSFNVLTLQYSNTHRPPPRIRAEILLNEIGNDKLIEPLLEKSTLRDLVTERLNQNKSELLVEAIRGYGSGTIPKEKYLEYADASGFYDEYFKEQVPLIKSIEELNKKMEMLDKTREIMVRAQDFSLQNARRNYVKKYIDEREAPILAAIKAEENRKSIEEYEKQMRLSWDADEIIRQYRWKLKQEDSRTLRRSLKGSLAEMERLYNQKNYQAVLDFAENEEQLLEGSKCKCTCHIKHITSRCICDSWERDDECPVHENCECKSWVEDQECLNGGMSANDDRDYRERI